MRGIFYTAGLQKLNESMSGNS